MELVIGVGAIIAILSFLLPARARWVLGGLLAAALVLALLLAASQAVSLMLSLIALLLLLLLLAGAGAVAYFYFNPLRQREASPGLWLPGPYAYWGQMPNERAFTLPASHPSALPPQAYGLPYPGYQAIPLEEEEDDEDLVPPWWA